MMKQQKGFSLIEVMTATAIIGILASIAIPSYSAYTKKAKFTEVITAVAPVKMSLENCASLDGVWRSATCPTETFTYSKYIQDGRVSFPDEWTVNANFILADGNGFKGETYNLVGTIYQNEIEWVVDPSSTCLESGICRK